MWVFISCRLQAPLHGTAVVAGSVVIYSPNVSYIGNDFFDYYIVDDMNASDTGHVIVSTVPLQPYIWAIPNQTALNWVLLLTYITYTNKLLYRVGGLSSFSKLKWFRATTQCKLGGMVVGN